MQTELSKIVNILKQKLMKFFFMKKACLQKRFLKVMRFLSPPYVSCYVCENVQGRKSLLQGGVIIYLIKGRLGSKVAA